MAREGYRLWFCKCNNFNLHGVFSRDKFLRSWNENPKPFIWTATVEGIMTKIERARVKMERIQPGSTLPRSRNKERNSL